MSARRIVETYLFVQQFLDSQLSRQRFQARRHIVVFPRAELELSRRSVQHADSISRSRTVLGPALLDGHAVGCLFFGQESLVYDGPVREHASELSPHDSIPLGRFARLGLVSHFHPARAGSTRSSACFSSFALLWMRRGLTRWPSLLAPPCRPCIRQPRTWPPTSRNSPRALQPVRPMKAIRLDDDATTRHIEKARLAIFILTRSVSLRSNSACPISASFSYNS